MKGHRRHDESLYKAKSWVGRAGLAGAMVLIGLLIAHYFYPFPLWAEAKSGKAEIMVDPEKIVGIFSPELLSVNLQWTSDGDGLLMEKNGQKVLNLKVVEAVKALPNATIRFPGGQLSSRYIWRDGVGPQRKQGLNFVGGKEPMNFGTDECLELINILGTKGMITANPKRPAEEAADWLRYTRQENGNIPYWEYGNESFLPQEPSYMPVKDYTLGFNRFQKVVKEVDPGIKVGALLEGSLISTQWGKYIVPELDNWNETVIRETAGTADFYVAHLYALFDTEQGEKKALTALAAASEAMSQNLRHLKKDIEKHQSKAELWITEFNVLTKTPQDNWKYGTSFAQAGYIASMLLSFSRNNVTGAYYWSLIGNHNFGLIKDGKTLIERPAALVYRLMAPLAGAQLCSTQIMADHFDYQTTGNVISGLKPKVLDAQAFVNKDILQLVLINRVPDNALQVKVKLPSGYDLDLQSGGQVVIKGPHALSNNEKAPMVVMVNEPAAMSLTLPQGSVCRIWAKLIKK